MRVFLSASHVCVCEVCVRCCIDLYILHVSLQNGMRSTLKMGKTRHFDEDGTAAGDNYNLSSLESFFADVYLFGCATKAVLPADT